jgi:anti-sigma B factor antagonist
MNLHIDIEEQNDQTTLHLKGEIDVYTAPALKEALYPLAEKEKHVILLDLKHVEYLDSTGLGTIIGAMKIAAGYHRAFQSDGNQGEGGE